MKRLLRNGRQAVAAFLHGRRVNLLLHAGRPVLSRNLLAYGPTEANGMTATIGDDLGLHITSTSLTTGKGIAWDMGILPAGRYRIRPMGDAETPYTLVYIAILNESGSVIRFWDAGKGDIMRFLLAKPQRVKFTVTGKVGSTGKPINTTLHPMLAVDAQWPDMWVPPIHVDARGLNRPS